MFCATLHPQYWVTNGATPISKLLRARYLRTYHIIKSKVTKLQGLRSTWNSDLENIYHASWICFPNCICAFRTVLPEYKPPLPASPYVQNPVLRLYKSRALLCDYFVLPLDMFITFKSIPRIQVLLPSPLTSLLQKSLQTCTSPELYCRVFGIGFGYVDNS